MKRKHVFCAILLLSSVFFFYGQNAFAQPTWFPIPLSAIPGGLPINIPGPPTAETPVGPPPPNMMPPAPPPAGNSFIGTTGISEYGSTIYGGTVLGTTGTDPAGGSAAAQLGSPLLLPPYARAETQTDAALSSLYPFSGSVRVRRAPAPAVYAGVPPTPPGLPLTPPTDAGGARSGSSIPFSPDRGEGVPTELGTLPVGK